MEDMRRTGKGIHSKIDADALASNITLRLLKSCYVDLAYKISSCLACKTCKVKCGVSSTAHFIVRRVRLESSLSF